MFLDGAVQVLPLLVGLDGGTCETPRVVLGGRVVILCERLDRADGRFRGERGLSVCPTPDHLGRVLSILPIDAQVRSVSVYWPQIAPKPNFNDLAVLHVPRFLPHRVLLL